MRYWANMHVTIISIVLKPGSIRWVDPWPDRPGAGPGRVEEKTGEGKTRRDLATQLSWQDPVKNPVATRLLLFFLRKRHHFNFFKNWFKRPGDPIKTRNPGLEPGRIKKTMTISNKIFDWVNLRFYKYIGP
jgi:hypothetical protein